MSEDEELSAEVSDPLLYTRVRGRSTKEIGATKAFHADCPCCGYRFAVEHSAAQQSQLNRSEQTFKRKVRNKIQEYFTNCWSWKTNEREFCIGGKRSPNKSRRISSASVDAVIQSGAGHFLRYAYRRNLKDWNFKRWFAVLWHDAPVIGEMFFACMLKDLFPVLQAIADDSPEFAHRLRRAADNALKRDGSAARGGGNGDLAAGRGEGGVEGFDAGSAVRVSSS